MQIAESEERKSRKMNRVNRGKYKVQIAGNNGCKSRKVRSANRGKYKVQISSLRRATFYVFCLSTGRL